MNIKLNILSERLKVANGQRNFKIKAIAIFFYV